MVVLETYLNTLANLRNATVPETSYYATLQTLLNDVGAGLRPVCMQLKTSFAWIAEVAPTGAYIAGIRGKFVNELDKLQLSDSV